MLLSSLRDKIVDKLRNRPQYKVKNVYSKLAKGKTIEFTPTSSRIVRRNPVSDMFANGKTSIWNGRMLKESPEFLNDEEVVYQIPSTAIAHVRYDPKTHRLYQTFRGGSKEYVYDVSPEEFKKYMQAGSKGRHTAYVLKYQNRAPKSWWD